MKKILITLMLVGAQLANAQWTNEYNTNTIVSTLATDNIQSVARNDGKTYVVFWENLTDGNYYDLKVQLIDSEGNIEWTNDGISVKTDLSMSSYTSTSSIAVDSENNLYLGYTTTGDGHGYVSKISPTGERLYGNSGVDLGASVYSIKLLPAGNQVVVGYYTSGKGKLAKFNADGTSAWETPITIDYSSTTGNNYTSVGEMALLSDNSFIILFHTRAVAYTINSSLWAQRYTEDGAEAWETPIRVSNQTLAYNRSYQTVVANNSVYLGYYGSTGTRFDSFVQKINEDGSLPWGSDGSDSNTDNTILETTTNIAFTEDGSSIWLASNITDANQGTRGEIIQRFDASTGERQLGDTGYTVSSLSQNDTNHEGEIRTFGNKAVVLLKTGPTYGAQTLKVAVLNEDGSYYNNTPANIATAAYQKSRFNFLQIDNDEYVATWIETRNGTSNAYAQNYKTEELAIGDNAFNLSVNIYPNPFKEQINVVSKEDIKLINIYNLSGQLVGQSTQKVVKTSNLPKGTYIIEINFKNGKKLNKKLIK